MTDGSQRQRDILICLCLALVTAAVYWPIKHYDFINFDDEKYITENLHLRDGLTVRGLGWAFTTGLDQWMPVTWLARILEYQLFGLDAGGHHLVNLLFHIANTLLLFGILKRMTSATWRSALVAGLFALHPLHVESVAWVTGLKDVLSMCLGLLTIWAYGRYVEHLNVQRSTSNVERSTPLAPLSAAASAKEEAPTTAGRSLVRRSLGEGGKLHVSYGLTLLLFALALMAKPMMVTLPFVLLLLDCWPLGRTQWVKPAVGGKAQPSLSQLLKEKLPFLVLTAVSCVATCLAQRGAVQSLDRLPIEARLANAAVSYVRYLGKAFWPEGLAAFYPNRRWPVDAVAGAGVVLIAVSVWVIRRARREPQFVVGWLWYLGTLVPVIGLVQVGSQSMADRYTYLPFIGLFVMAAWAIPSGAVQQRVGRMIVAVVAVLLLGVCAVLSRLQVRHWRNSVTVFEHAVAVTKDNDVAYFNLGSALAHEGRIEEALGQFEQALRIRPRNADVHYNLGLALVLLGRLPEAMRHYEQALQISPHNALRHYDLANLLRTLGRAPEAIGHYEQALRLKPDFAEAHFNLGFALSQVGKIDDGVGHYEQALRLRPDYAEAHFNLGLNLQQMGKLPEAIEHYERVLQLKPHFAVAQNNLAWLLATLPPAEGGDPARAMTLAERLCNITGNREAAYLDTLAAAYAAVGRFADAVATAQKAIELARSAGQPQVAGEIETRQLLYRDGHVYHQPIHVTSPARP